MADGNGAVEKERPVPVSWAPSECGMFTIRELMAIHRELRLASWQPEVFYDERRAAVKKLDDFFGRFGTEDHLKGKNL